MLMIWCDVCYAALPCGEEEETVLLMASQVYCRFCKQPSVIDKELKNDIRKRRGMNPID